MIIAQFARLYKPGNELTQIAKDVWVTAEPVPLHVDNTEIGLRVFGLVLLNDIDLELHYCGGIFPLPVGGAYCIDGRIGHGALPASGARQIGLFAVRIWDMPPEMTLARFKEEASRERIEPL